MDAGRFKPMIGQVEDTQTHPGFAMVHIRVAAGKNNVGKTMPVPHDLLQPHKVNRLQAIGAIKKQLPEYLQDVKEFSVFTDKNEAYPDYNDPTYQKISFDGPTKDRVPSWDSLFGDKEEADEPETNDLDQARKALGVSDSDHPSTKSTGDDYMNARDFLMGGRTTIPMASHPRDRKREERPVPVSHGLGRRLRGSLEN